MVYFLQMIVISLFYTMTESDRHLTFTTSDHRSQNDQLWQRDRHSKKINPCNAIAILKMIIHRKAIAS